MTRTNRPDFDVAVTGGGIAGAAACIALNRAGLRTLWNAPDPAPKSHPVGESLAPAAGPILARLGLGHLLDDARHRQANATFSAWGSDRLGERNAIVHLEGPGWVLDRARFEADMRAAADGTACRHRADLVGVSADAGYWRLDLAGGRTLAARFLVDATGRAQTAARLLPVERQRDDRLVAACAFLPHRDHGVEPTPATLIESAPDGWWYAALLPDGRLSLAFFSDPDLIPRGLSRSLDAWRTLIGRTMHIARWIDDAGFAIEAPPHLHSAGTTWLSRAAGLMDGAGWAAVGDAAAAFDPLSSHGMTTALWTAARVADAASALLGRDDSGPLSGYADAVTAGIARFRTERATLYGRERRFADAPFWRRRSGAERKFKESLRTD